MPPGLRSTQEIGSVTAAYQPPLATMMEKTTMSQFGYAPDSLPFVETVSPHLRKNILEGKEVNLASLLIPQYSGPSPMFTSSGEKYDKPDPKLNRNLSITEFMQAFGTYKNIMCEGYPNRRVELDLYERDIIEMATKYKDSRFYEYHKQFSAKAAAHLIYNNIKVDWSPRDSKLYCNIFASHQAITCALCSSVSHSTGFCPKSLDNTLSLSTRFSYEKGGDNLNRTKTSYQGQEICNHFNKERSCFRINCKYAHLCLTCKKEHSQSRCPLANSPERPKEVNLPLIPINIDKLDNYLADHPDKNFVSYLINGLTQRFDTGLKSLPSSSLECQNLLSARTQKGIVAELIQSEVNKGFISGPYEKLPFSIYRVNPLGIAESKYSGKKRLIFDLSAPDNDVNHASLNDLIQKEEFSLNYVTMTMQ